jgi:hypothetical protein
MTDGFIKPWDVMIVTGLNKTHLTFWLTNKSYLWKKEHQSDFLVSMFKLVKLIIKLYIFTVIILN